MRTISVAVMRAEEARCYLRLRRFAVTKLPYQAWYSVTHIKTGASADAKLKTLKDARELARALESDAPGELEFMMFGCTNFSADVINKTKAIVESHAWRNRK